MKKSLFTLLALFFSILLTACHSDMEQKKLLKNEDVGCPEIYQPVCGKIEVQCITTPCDPVEQTFENDCFAKKAKATDIQKGACKTQEQTSTEDLNTTLKNALKEKMKSLSKITDFEVKEITHQTDTHIRGIVKLTDVPGQGPFLAVKNDGRWKVVFQGNKKIICSEMLAFEFPAEMLFDCVEEVEI